MIQPLTIVGIGELLWDLFPTGRALGGAPANFAYCSNLLGDTGVVVSRVGADELGNDIRESLATFGITDDFLQTDADRATGTVKVKLDPAGQPDFDITYPAAWDFLEWNEALHRLAQSADAVCFGSLAQRSPQSRKTIRKFLDSVRTETAKIFDVNLRQTYYSAEVMSESIARATIVKLNQAEVPEAASLLRLSSTPLQVFGRSLLKTFPDLRLVCITRGEQGSLLVDNSAVYEHAGFRVKVRDAVGAGDAFTAGLINQLLHGVPLPEANDFANRMGAWVASSAGAMPPVHDEGLMKALSQLV